MDAERAAGNGYELIVARHVLQRLPFPERVLAGISGLLVEGGLLAMMVPNPGGTMVDGPSLFTDLRVWWNEEPTAMKGAGGMTDLQLASHRWVTEHLRFRHGWLPMLEAAKLHPEDFGRRPHRALQPAECEWYVFARRVR